MAVQKKQPASRRSSRQLEQADASNQATNNNIVALISDGDEEDEQDAASCSACGVANERVMVTCAACTLQFHLGCTTPVLRRRPVLASAWRCAACAQPAGTSANPRRQRSAKNTGEAVGGDDMKKNETKAQAAIASAAEGANSRTVRKRVAGSASAAAAPMKTEEQSGSDGDRGPPKKSRRMAPAAAVKAEVKTEAAATPVKRIGKGKLQKSAAASVKVSVKRAMTTKGKKPAARASSKSAKKAFTTDSDGDEVDSGGDDDGDSDFKSDDASDSKSDDDDFDPDASDDDDEFVAPGKKLPSLKTTPNKKNKGKSPAKAKSPASSKKSPAKRRATSNNENGSTAAAGTEGTEAVTANGNDVDSMDLPNHNGESEDEEEEVYAGPRYYIEYAANNRARVCMQASELCSLALLFRSKWLPVVVYIVQAVRGEAHEGRAANRRTR